MWLFSARIGIALMKELANVGNLALVAGSDLGLRVARQSLHLMERN
jgi:hypothetical protein